jgi:hypothetical protein
MAMDHADNVIDIRTPVEFSIEGRRYETGHRRQQARELRVHRPLPVRYQPDDTILIRRNARFVAVRMQAGVM